MAEGALGTEGRLMKKVQGERQEEEEPVMKVPEQRLQIQA